MASSYVPLVPKNLAHPPIQWTASEVKAWLKFCVEEFSLSPVCVTRFDMNGKALCLLTRTDFIERAPHAGDVLYNVFQKLSQQNGAQLVCQSQLPPPVLVSNTAHQPCPSSRFSFVPILPQPTHNTIYPHTSSTDNTSTSSSGVHVPASMLSPAPSDRSPSDSDSSCNTDLISPLREGIDVVEVKPADELCNSPTDEEATTSSDSGCRLLWEFMYQLLEEPRHSSLVCWVSKPDLTFRINDQTGLADLWGQQKNKGNMTYEKLSRALRYYYKMNIIKKVAGRRLTYKFLQHPTKIQKGQRGARPHASRIVSTCETAPRTSPAPTSVTEDENNPNAYPTEDRKVEIFDSTTSMYFQQTNWSTDSPGVNRVMATDPPSFVATDSFSDLIASSNSLADVVCQSLSVSHGYTFTGCSTSSSDTKAVTPSSRSSPTAHPGTSNNVVDDISGNSYAVPEETDQDAVQDEALAKVKHCGDFDIAPEKSSQVIITSPGITGVGDENACQLDYTVLKSFTNCKENSGCMKTEQANEDGTTIHNEKGGDIKETEYFDDENTGESFLTHNIVKNQNDQISNYENTFSKPETEVNLQGRHQQQSKFTQEKTKDTQQKHLVKKRQHWQQYLNNEEIRRSTDGYCRQELTHDHPCDDRICQSPKDVLIKTTSGTEHSRASPQDNLVDKSRNDEERYRNKEYKVTSHINLNTVSLESKVQERGEILNNSPTAAAFISSTRRAVSLSPTIGVKVGGEQSTPTTTTSTCTLPIPSRASSASNITSSPEIPQSFSTTTRHSSPGGYSNSMIHQGFKRKCLSQPHMAPEKNPRIWTIKDEQTAPVLQACDNDVSPFQHGSDLSVTVTDSRMSVQPNVHLTCSPPYSCSQHTSRNKNTPHTTHTPRSAIHTGRRVDGCVPRQISPDPGGLLDYKSQNKICDQRTIRHFEYLEPSPYNYEQYQNFDKDSTQKNVEVKLNGRIEYVDNNQSNCHPKTMDYSQHFRLADSNLSLDASSTPVSSNCEAKIQSLIIPVSSSELHQMNMARHLLRDNCVAMVHPQHRHEAEEVHHNPGNLIGNATPVNGQRNISYTYPNLIHHTHNLSTSPHQSHYNFFALSPCTSSKPISQTDTFDNKKSNPRLASLHSNPSYSSHIHPINPLTFSQFPLPQAHVPYQIVSNGLQPSSSYNQLLDMSHPIKVDAGDMQAQHEPEDLSVKSNTSSNISSNTSSPIYSNLKPNNSPRYFRTGVL